MKKSQTKYLLALALLMCFGANAFAGTGGAELQAWYTDISGALQGFWGKIIAAVFMGIAIILFKSGGIIGGIFMMMIGLSVGMIPDIIDSRYTALMVEQHTVNMFDAMTIKLSSLASSVIH